MVSKRVKGMKVYNVHYIQHLINIVAALHITLTIDIITVHVYTYNLCNNGTGSNTSMDGGHLTNHIVHDYV